ncbi:conserved hypothetical protein [Candidatus Accumulibacter aalborgensis]|uniref:Preprotein translocase subunit SecB n=1 Tax=Candidatus Accumulibacter aalborgensis TaxID=1860102 RepID=A0A1A8XK13_9PROT|nr:preprotein translocase subunit SecB [Candidatus Accumulibacter aalborgensis]SBT04737.1 conserved hypothetical protein [Candidatus Accumulibacter aalborgensis]
MITPLQHAVECLQIRDVLIHDSEAFIAEDFDPKYGAGVDGLQIQLKHMVSHSQVLEVEDGEQTQQLFRVFIQLGARWVEAAPREQGGGEGTVAEEQVKAQIEATLIAEYALTDHPGKEALDAFALKNASYHVWPYWREYLSSQCQRMGLPKVVVPTIQVAQHHLQQGESRDIADS